jgi:hypothetical protein
MAGTARRPGTRVVVPFDFHRATPSPPDALDCNHEYGSMLPPDCLNNADACMKALHSTADLWFGRLSLSTKVVAVGLVFEAPELIWEIAFIIRCKYEKWKLHITFPERHVPDLVKVVAFVGWFLIVGGVVGEWYTEGKFNEADTNIQELNDVLRTEAIKEASDAATSAKIAHEEADAVKGIADEARADAKDALAKAQAAQRELANAEAGAAKAQAAASNALTTATDASARAGKAEASLGEAETEAKNAENSASNALTIAQEARQDAASFESDLVRLKKQAADRVLDERQQADVVLKIGAFLGSPYELETVDTSEAANLLVELDAALSSAGWIYKESEDKTFRFVGHMRNGKQFDFVHGGRGVEIGLTKTLGARFKPAADKLAKALNSEEILAMVVVLPDSNPSPNNIHIMVLGKP